MRANELIAKLGELGYRAASNNAIGIDEYISVAEGQLVHADGDAGRLPVIVATVGVKRVGVLDTQYSGFHQLTDDDRLALLDVLTDYAATPLEERQPEPTYLYALPVVRNIYGHPHYFYKKQDGGIDTQPMPNRRAATNKPSCHFTRSEVDALPTALRAVLKNSSITPIQAEED